jgi:hypothetical protein
MASCKQVYRYICDNLDQNVNSSRCRAIRRHLAACADCATYLDSLKKTVTLYRVMPEPRVPATAHRVLVSALAELHEKSSGRAKPRRGIKPGWR